MLNIPTTLCQKPSNQFGVNGISCIPHSQPHEVFVGNLSFFCTESHLYHLFNEYAHVTNVRLARNGHKTRCLMFGFVAFSTAAEAKEISVIFRDHFFMGRSLRVELSDNDSTKPKLTKNLKSSFQVQLTMSSSFSHNQIVIPTEAVLRKYFLQFGCVNDVVVRDYSLQAAENRQYGHGYIEFDSEDACSLVIAEPVHNMYGIFVLCSITNNNNNIINNNVINNNNRSLSTGNNNIINVPSYFPSYVSNDTSQHCLFASDGNTFNSSIWSSMHNNKSSDSFALLSNNNNRQHQQLIDGRTSSFSNTLGSDSQFGCSSTSCFQSDRQSHDNLSVDLNTFNFNSRTTRQDLENSRPLLFPMSSKETMRDNDSRVFLNSFNVMTSWP